MRLTVLQFSHGLYHSTVDFTVCRRGLAAERIVALSMDPYGDAEVINCRALGKERDEYASKST